MTESDQLYEEFTVPLSSCLPAAIEVRGITRETLHVLIEMEKERGYILGLRDGIANERKANNGVQV